MKNPLEITESLIKFAENLINMLERDRYPIGQQDFREIRVNNAYYVDKTSFIEKIIRSQSKFYFLARPRRFGKSLFLSTLEYFFKGERELFRGLAIDSAEWWKWETYPVLHLDLNTDKYDEAGVLDDVLDNIFRKWEDEFGVETIASPLSSRFRNIIAAAHHKTGMQVVILVDEYDKPLVGNLNNDKKFEIYRRKLASIYANFKSASKHIRLVFLTGVSRFSKLSVFSDLNNLNDITFDNEYADICGITEKELHDNFIEGIQAFALKKSISVEDTCGLLKRNYDGYRFAEEGSEIYNPWSVLNCLSKRVAANYWSMTGGATVVAECLRNIDADLSDVLNTKCDLQSLVGLDLKNADPLALLYQTGYLTIKEYDPETEIISLGVPNNEVKDDLSRVLLPMYVNLRQGYVEAKIRDLIASIKLGRPDELMNTLATFFSGVSYEMKMENENNFQNAVYILLTLIGANAKVEERTSAGRIDLLIETPKFVYIIEFKFDGSASEALNQIKQKGYARRFATGQRRIFKIGASFSSKTRTIDDVLIE